MRAERSAPITLTRQQAEALVAVANLVLIDGDSGIDRATQERAAKALGRIMLAHGARIGRVAGAVSYTFD